VVNLPFLTSDKATHYVIKDFSPLPEKDRQKLLKDAEKHGISISDLSKYSYECSHFLIETVKATMIGKTNVFLSSINQNLAVYSSAFFNFLFLEAYFKSSVKASENAGINETIAKKGYTKETIDQLIDTYKMKVDDNKEDVFQFFKNNSKDLGPGLIRKIKESLIVCNEQLLESSPSFLGLKASMVNYIKTVEDLSASDIVKKANTLFCNDKYYNSMSKYEVMALCVIACKEVEDGK
jgi:hypothetical protein